MGKYIAFQPMNEVLTSMLPDLAVLAEKCNLFKNNLVHAVSMNLRTRYLELINKTVTESDSAYPSAAMGAIDAHCMGCELVQKCRPRVGSVPAGDRNHFPSVEIATDDM